MNEREWIKRCEHLITHNNRSKWALGDWLLKSDYDEGLAEVSDDEGRTYKNWISKAAQEFHFDYGTLLEYRRIAKIFPKEDRATDLSWNHHRVIATESVDDRERWLECAYASNWSVKELRLKVAASRGAKKKQPSQYDLTKQEHKTIRFLVKRTHLRENQVLNLIVRWWLSQNGSTKTLEDFIDSNKIEQKYYRESYQDDRQALNGGTLKRWRSVA